MKNNLEFNLNESQNFLQCQTKRTFSVSIYKACKKILIDSDPQSTQTKSLYHRLDMFK